MRLTRILDIVFSAGGLLVCSPLLAILYVLGRRDGDSSIFLQERVGRHKKLFILYKFRTMRAETPNLPTHLVAPDAVTPYGRFLRRSKLDELPQLWNVLRGDMSLVGPRPCLYSQTELIRAREEQGVFEVSPGITGLAQINGVDMSDPIRLAALDAQMLQQLTVISYIRYVISTVLGRGTGDRVRE